MKIVASILAAVLPMATAAQNLPEQFKLSGVSLRPSVYQGSNALEVRMPPAQYQNPLQEALSDRNFMAWLPMDFGDGTIEVDLASDLAADAPDYARGFVGLAFRIDAKGHFENLYLRPTNSTAPDQIRRNHTIQYAAYPDFRFDQLRQQSPEKYETWADIATGQWIHLRVVIDGATLRLYLDGSPRPAFIVNDMKLPATQRGGVGIWIESGTVAHFKNLHVTTTTKR
ncbi:MULTISPECIES: LamG-like jellyroll fold domain-containing protein [unclassified Pseudomonas]|uniref:LamG-like jellyroll fold domain-containing protein n=1 Tax=unclassified Pseudomonas TaxID=196821 RepID=UPI00235F0CCE|nr:MULTISPECIES: LamG-like jellyroll fold domain-containing protein [unclassified Pseudomonas]